MTVDTTMFDDNTDADDDSTETEMRYAVTIDGDEVDTYETEEDAKDHAHDLSWNNPSASVTVYPYEVEAEEAADRYGFLDVAPEVEADVEKVSYDIEKWSLGRHTTASNEVEDDIATWLSQLDDDVDDDLKGVLNDAALMVGGSRVSDFECAVCGLNHGHSDSKHDIRPTFSVRDEFAEQMEFSPFCHCGVNELAMLVDFYGYINTPVFSDENTAFPTVKKVPSEVVDMLLVAHSRGSYRMNDEVLNVIQDSERLKRSEVKEFLKRVDNIKSAASSAPIAQETRSTIDELRGEVEERIHG